MKDAKSSGAAGFSLVEVLTAITVLGLILAPIGASLVLSHRLNARSQQLMAEQLAVSNAVETLMAEGIKAESIEEGKYTGYQPANGSPAVEIRVSKEEIPAENSENTTIAAFKVTVTSGSGAVEVETCIRPADTDDADQERGGESSDEEPTA